jgi:outer membrane protein
MTISRKMISIAAGLFLSMSVAAETIAVVDIQRVVSQLPQMAQIQQQLTQEFAAPSEEIKKLESDIKFNLEKYQRESATMSPEQQEELRATIEQMQKDFQAKAQPLEQQFRRRQAEERNKILALVKQAVDVIAADDKLDVVLNAQSVVFVKPEKDITDQVVTKVSKMQ